MSAQEHGQTWPAPDPRLPTEMALGCDGSVYVNSEGAAHEGRREFVGYALHNAEVRELGARRLLVWAVLGKLALGTDARVYVEKGGIDAAGRKEFRGIAASDEERACIVEELHRAALNFTVACRIWRVT